MQLRKTLLFHNNEPWVKKTRKEIDNRIDCYNVAEICEQVDKYILNRLKNVTKKGKVGLYRDDGLRIFQRKPKTEIERKKRINVRLFKYCGLSITIECNLKSVDFLDFIFDLVIDTHKPLL